MVRTLELRATQDGVIWPSRPLISARGLLSSIRNLPLTSYDKTQRTRFRDVTFNSTGDLLAATDEKGRVFVFFIASNRYALVQHLGVPTIACCFSPLRKSELLVTCENETARCIDVQSQVLVSTLRGHRYPARSASFQPSGKLALTASQDAVILWDTRDWSRFRVLNAGPGVEAATFVARGDLVAVCFQDDTIMMWALESLALQYRFALPEHERTTGLRTITVSPDHRMLVASGRSPFIYVWGFDAQTIVRIIELPTPITDVITHAFLPGHDSTISLLESGGALYYLDVAASKPRIQLEVTARDKRFTAFDIECHARYLAASTDDGFLLLYDLEIARETARRARIERHKHGLDDLNDSAQLRTRSGVAGADDKRGIDATSRRPVPSKLIESLFGAPSAATRHRNSSEQQHDERATGTVMIVTSNEPQPTAAPPAAKREPHALVSAPATLTPQEIDVNRKRLVASLRCNGAYPSKYRLLVWRFLLQLPQNAEAFRTLVAKGAHPAFVRLHEQYPLQNRRLFRRLHRVLSAIAFWCPAFGEVSYLPEVVYPFVKVFRENDLAAFEASMSVLLHWCSGFLHSLPHAPAAELQAIDRALAQRDPQLHAHFAQHNVTAEAYGWSLLRTLFTEVLSEHEWLTLWDHLFTAAADRYAPERLCVAVLAYLATFRSALLNTCDRASIEQFFHQQNALRLASFVQLFVNLCANNELLQSLHVHDEDEDHSSKDDDHATTGGGSAKAKAKTHWPLPRGQYPAFSRYPKFVVDFQISERTRIALEESELVRKQQKLADIEQQCAKLQAEHDAWLTQRRTLLAAEQTRRTEALAAEKLRLLHLKSLDQQTRQRRLERLSAMEQHAHESLETTAQVFQAEFERLEVALAAQRDRSEFELDARKQDEALERVEFETEKRVAAIHQQRSLEQRLETLRAEFAARAKQHELEDVAKFERWRREDDARKHVVQTNLQRREALAVVQHEATVRQKLEAELLNQLVAKERELAALETERTARCSEQRAFDALDDEIARRKRELETLQQHREMADDDNQGDANGRRSAIDDIHDNDGGGRHGGGLDDGTAQVVQSDRDDRERDTTEWPLDGGRLRTPPPPPSNGATRRRDDDPYSVDHATSDRASRGFGLHHRSMTGGHNRTAPGAAARANPSAAASSQPAGHRRRQTWTAATTPSSAAAAAATRPRRRASERAPPRLEQRAALERPSLLQSAASSNSSFTSAVLERTMEEMTLLERALRTISSSSNSSPSNSSSASKTSNKAGAGPAAAQNNSNSSSDSSSHASSSAVQRPIAELERELGIQFDLLDSDSGDEAQDDAKYYSRRGDDEDEEKKDEESESDDDDIAIEDDRARLLARAKKLLEAEDFTSDEEENDVA